MAVSTLNSRGPELELTTKRKGLWGSQKSGPHETASYPVLGILRTLPSPFPGMSATGPVSHSQEWPSYPTPSQSPICSSQAAVSGHHLLSTCGVPHPVQRTREEENTYYGIRGHVVQSLEDPAALCVGPPGW